jgi:hypothetical protein
MTATERPTNMVVVCLKLEGDPAEADALRFTEEAAKQIKGWR